MKDIWRVLALRLRNEDALLGNRIEPESLREIWTAEMAEIVVLDGSVIAFGALWPVTTERGTWFELGSLWVAKEFRGRGFISRLFASLVARIPTGSDTFLITHDPKVAHLALKHGMREEISTTWFANIPWEASCEPCDRVPNDNKPHCPLCSTSQCRLFSFCNVN